MHVRQVLKFSRSFSRAHRNKPSSCIPQTCRCCTHRTTRAGSSLSSKRRAETGCNSSSRFNRARIVSMAVCCTHVQRSLPNTTPPATGVLVLLSCGPLKQVPRVGPVTVGKPSASDRVVTEDDTLQAPEGAFGVRRFDFQPPGRDGCAFAECPEAE